MCICVCFETEIITNNNNNNKTGYFAMNRRKKIPFQIEKKTLNTISRFSQDLFGYDYAMNLYNIL